jgi:hypothetical protein
VLAVGAAEAFRPSRVYLSEDEGCLTNGLVKQKRFAYVFNFGNCAFEVESFRKDNLEDLYRVSYCGRGRVEEDRTFWTLILWLVLLKIRLARIAFANRRACQVGQQDP